MRRSDTIEGLIDKVCYLKELVDMGNLRVLESYLKARNILKRTIKGDINEKVI